MNGTRVSSRTDLVRRGFTELDQVAAGLAELAEVLGLPPDEILDGAESAADPDEALQGILRIARRDAAAVRATPRPELWRVLGASSGLARFFLRHPAELRALDGEVPDPRGPEELRARLRAAVGAGEDGVAAGDPDTAVKALRIAYRRELTAIVRWDLAHPDPVEAVSSVSAALADLAGAALDAGLCVARAASRFRPEKVAATRLSIIGMGKAGARELNYVSDVDVIFVADTADEELLSEQEAVQVATGLAQATMRALSSMEAEPALWEVDANLRPEGAKGALVRSLDSHIAYYERWAESWEFQALLKARPLAGDPELGAAYIAAVQPKVWSSAARANFVDSVQRMRERVTENIPADELPVQLKLGPGGLRDIEFTVQLLQLVHGLTDDTVRVKGTLRALDALVAKGYIGRADAEAFARDYRTLRVWEHRLQLQDLSRTHLMPTDPERLRVLARASRLADSAEMLIARWEGLKREVREIHLKLFYRPLLGAVASLGADEAVLTSEQAHDRLAAIGFRDPAGALRHIQALTSGLSRRAAIQRTLLPVMLHWLAEGADPDYGLLAFRRLADALGETPWFLRLLRDSAGAAQRLTRLLSGSRFVGELLEGFPEATAWLDDQDMLAPRPRAQLEEEISALFERHESAKAMKAIRKIRRRELLRLGMASVLTELITVKSLGATLTEISEITISAALRAARLSLGVGFPFAIIAMGRTGGAEMAVGSDADVLFVYESGDEDPERAARVSVALVAEIRNFLDDGRFPLDLDADLRPEGRQGPLTRTLEAYENYYERWSLSWEAQALLRARGIAGDPALIARFETLADRIRYPVDPDPQGIREIKRIKARVEGERLPQGADPARHLKLGPGSLSDVEWLVQLLQLQHAARIPALRTTSTLDALAAAAEAGLIGADETEKLNAAWRLSSRLRSAITLYTGKLGDLLPVDRQTLDGVGRVLGYPPRAANAVEQEYLATTRRSRRVFEKLFYG